MSNATPSGPRLPRTTFTLSLSALSLLVRAVLTAVAGLLVISRGPAVAGIWLAVTLLIPLVSVRLRSSNAQVVALCAEAAAVAIVVVATSDPESPLLPLLAAPLLTGGLRLGVGGAIAPGGVAAAVLLIGASLDLVTDVRTYTTSAAEWVVLALAMGFAGAWANRVAQAAAEPPAVDPAYAAAHRLLSQLRTVARELPMGLDPGTVGAVLLESLAPVTPFDRAVVAVRSSGGRMSVLAHRGGQRPDWEITVEEEGSAFQEAWVSQTPVQAASRLDGRRGHALVLPLVIGIRSSGLVALESELGWTPEQISAALRHVSAAALQLEAATLFDEVREVATAEERRRLAREIHDSVAQELSYVGYVLDGLAAQAKRGGSELEAPVRELRAEVTRLVSELRLSMFELRSDVATHATLGAALADHAQSVAKSSGVAVHLSLRELSGRLPTEVEAGLLRIAQESLADVRRRPDTKNVWVTLEVEPPRARMVIEHDGADVLARRRDDRELESSVEQRATRIRAQVTTTPRAGGGRRVEVSVGRGTCDIA